MRPGDFAERFNIVGLAASLDAAALSPPAVNMRDCVAAHLVLIKAAGTAGDDPVITLTQGDGISSGALVNGKALACIDRVYTKRHASAIPKTYTAETQAAAATYTSLTLAEEAGHVVITVLPEDLDVDNGFHAVRAVLNDVGSNAQIGAMFWILEPKYLPPLDAQSDA